MPSALVIQTSFPGDVVLTTPLIAELSKRGPVDVLATPLGAGVLENNPGVRAVFNYDKRATYGAAMHTWHTIRRIRVRPAYDAVYLAQGSIRSAALAMLTGSRERVGFSTSDGRALYTRKVEYRPEKHHSERLWWLSMSDCADPPLAEQLRVRVYPSDSDRAAADNMLREAAIADGDFIALAPGSAWGTKRWPFYPELAARLISRYPIVVIGGNGDCAAADAIVDRVKSTACMNAAGKLSILASAEMIGRARALVTNDSLAQHLASAMGTPTLTLFGPTVPDFGFGPLAPSRATAGVTKLACRPCDRHGPQKCPLGHWRCMREMPPADVSAMLDSLLASAAAA